MSLFSKLDADHYRLVWPEYEIECELDHVRREHGELKGELTVSCGLLGTSAIDGCLHSATFNISSTRARQELAKILKERAKTGAKLDWHARLEELCQQVRRADERGDPAIVLRDVPRPNPDAEFDVEGFRFPKDQASITFGDGSSLKSYHGLFTIGTLQQRGLRTALFDWELTADAHRLRLEQLFGAAMPDLRYVRCDRPLIYEVDRLRKIVRDNKLDLALFDSVAYACPGPPEAAEHAMAYFRAVRQLGIGSLHIAHVRQGEGNDLRPFGSSFWHNSARSTWHVKLASTSPDGQMRCIGLLNRKANLSPLRPAIAFEVTFDGGRTAFRRVRIADVDELAASLPLWQRIKEAIRWEPKTLVRLAEELAASVDTIQKTVRRKDGVFTRVSGTDGITRIGLLERGVA